MLMQEHLGTMHALSGDPVHPMLRSAPSHFKISVLSNFVLFQFALIYFKFKMYIFPSLGPAYDC